MFSNRWVVGLDKSNVSFMFFVAELDEPSALSDVHLFWISTCRGRWMAPSDTKSTENLPIPTSTYTKNPITIQPTNTQSSHPWYTEQKPCAIKNPLHRNWHSSPLSSNRTATATMRYNEPWNSPHRTTRPRKNPCLQPTYHTPKLHSVDSAECWPNIISRASPYHPGKYPATCHQ